MFWMRNKENNFPIRTLIWRPEVILQGSFLGCSQRPHSQWNLGYFFPILKKKPHSSKKIKIIYHFFKRKSAGITITPVSIFLPTCIYIGTSLFSFMGNQTIHEDSNRGTCFKYKYKLSYEIWLSQN